MKTRWKIAIVFGVILALGVMLFAIARSRAASAVEAYRKELIEKGEKLTMAELLPPKQVGVEDGGPEFFAAASLLTPEFRLGSIWAGPGVARVRWREMELMELHYEGETNLWPRVRAEVAVGEALRLRMLEALRKPAFSAPIDYGSSAYLWELSLRHLSEMMNAFEFFALSGLLNLRDGHFERAIEDATAVIQMSARTGNEPFIYSQLVRYSGALTAAEMTGESLQHDGWSDEQLRDLQEHWEKFDPLEGLDYALATERVLYIDFVRYMREAGPNSYAKLLGQSPAEFTISRDIFSEPIGTLKELRRLYPAYRAWKLHWIEEEELELLKFFQETLEGARRGRRDRSFGFMPGVEATEAIFWQSQSDNPRFLLRSMGAGPSLGAFLERARLAQIMREITVTAIALERFRLAHGRYPSELKELQPGFLSFTPRDYFDDQPLRYRLRDDGSFLLYSIGENGIDDGGNPASGRSWFSGLDWVWPRPATAEEVSAHRAELIETWKANNEMESYSDGSVDGFEAP